MAEARKNCFIIVISEDQSRKSCILIGRVKKTMEGFLEENNNCGQVLLHLVSRGNAIISELLRLKDFIPPFFRPISADEIIKWENVIYDFSYFKNPEEFDEATRSNAKKLALYHEIQDNHLDLINRFYVAFESIHKFATDINNYVDDLEEGAYIQQNLDAVFKNEDGSQLLCETVYLYGVMLLVLELHIPGIVREKILVSYYRYSGKKTILGSNVDDVCRMLRSTGHSYTCRPPFYPDSYFQRVALRQQLVDLVIDGLRSEDMYHQIDAFPCLEHHTTALASQAAMLFVCLFFKPEILETQTAKMRNIVDKYFSDNWVVSIYMGITINLLDAWEPYKAAKAALANTMEAANIKQLIQNHSTIITKDLTEYKAEAALQGPIPGDKWNSYLSSKTKLLTRFNVTTRWMLLHCNINHHLFSPGKQSISLHNQIKSIRQFNSEEQLELLLTTAELELKVKNMYKTLLECREQFWEKNKKEAYERTSELKDLLSETNPVGRGKKNEQLSKWFGTMSGIIDSLNFDNLQDSTKKILGIITALEEVKGHIEALGRKQLGYALAELRQGLVVMVQGKSQEASQRDLIYLQIVADLSYGWLLVNELSPCVRTRIQREPEHVARLRALFLKLASAMETPLLRINQAGSQDLMSVSQHYSDELVSYVRTVLNIIPQKMVVLMLDIMRVKRDQDPDSGFVDDLILVDDKPQRNKMDVQLQLAELTQRVARFADGILQMKSTLVGVIEIDPKKMLEDGIRNELVIKLSMYFESILQFSKKSKHDELKQKLEDLSRKVAELMNSLEYIQDYLSICGLKICQEEMNRVVGFNVDMESNAYLKEKVLPWQSAYYSRAVPIPCSQPTTFMGRLLDKLIFITDYKKMTYYPSTMSWFDAKSKGPAEDGGGTGMRLFHSMAKAIGVSGLVALDRLVSYNIVFQLKSLLRLLNENLKQKNWIDFLTKISKELSPIEDVISNPTSYYGGLMNRPHLIRLFGMVRHQICRLGQLQLIRKHIFLELSTSCKFYSRGYFKALHNLNRALVGDIKEHLQDRENKPHPDEDGQLLSEVSVLSEWAGLGEPGEKVYIAEQRPPFLPLVTFLYALREVNNLKYNQRHGIFTSAKSGDHIDGQSFMTGLDTFLHQFHSDNWVAFSSYFSQFVKSHAFVHQLNKGQLIYPADVCGPIYLMEKLVAAAKLPGCPRSELSQFMPTFLLYPNCVPKSLAVVDYF